MTVQATMPNPRINVFAIIGSALFVAGAFSLYTNYTATITRYMYVEGLEYAGEPVDVDVVTAATPTDTLWKTTAGIMVLLGIVAIIVAIVQYCTARSRRPGPPGVPSLPRPQHDATAG